MEPPASVQPRELPEPQGQGRGRTWERALLAVDEVMAAAVFSPSSLSLAAWEERRHPAHAIKRAKSLFPWDRGMILCLTLKMGPQPRALGGSVPYSE